MERKPLQLLPQDANRNEWGADKLEKLQYIEDFDFSDYRERAIHDGEVKELIGHLVEIELKRFFALKVLFPNHAYPMVPPLFVDLMWHHFILDTANYRKFCHDIFGEYLDHRPDKREVTIAEIAGEPWARTKQLRINAFGALTKPWERTRGVCNYAGDIENTH